MLLICTSGCRSLPPEKPIPLDPAPERPELGENFERNTVELIITDIRWRIWEAYARERTGEITKEMRESTVSILLDTLRQMQTELEGLGKE